jgi:hypothetical protein
MAAIFQIRRGSGSVSLMDGELYLHKNSGSLQVGSDTNIVTLAKLNEENIGSMILSGDLTASNAYISGNVVLGGNITIGDQTTDSITINADLDSDIIPNITKTYDLGSEDKWYKRIYVETVSASFISGAIEGIGDVREFSASVSSKFLETQYSTSSLNSFSASEESKNLTLATYTSSVNAKFLQTQYSTASLNVFSASEESKNLTLATYTASIDTKFVEVQSSTASLNSFSSSALGRLSNLESKSASVDVSLAEIHSYTSSLKTAIDLSGVDVTVLGNLTVNGTTTQINSTQVNIGENILELNFGGSATEAGIYTKDATGGSTISGSLLWDSTTDYWKAGKKDLESKILLAGGDGVLSGSTDFRAFSTSVDSRLTNLQTKSSSVDVSIVHINNETASIENRLVTLATYTGSVDTKFDNVGVATASLNTFTSSAASRLGNLETTSASIDNSVSLLNTFSGSQESKDLVLQTYTSSIDTKFVEVQSSTASLNTFSASVLSDLTSIHQTTASLNLFSASINFFSASVFTDFSNSYDAVSESFDYRISVLDPGNLSAAIDSLNQFTSSASSSLHYINQFTTSADSRLDNLEAKSASVDISLSELNSFTSSIDTTIKTKLNVEGVLSGSIQVLGGTNIVSASTDSNTVDFTITNGNITANLIGGVVSGSSQVIDILSSLNTYTGSNDTLNTTQNGRLTSLEAVTGSYELKGSGIHSGSVGNYQFNSIGVNVSPTGVAGEIIATGDITAFYSSDIRLKENIIPIPNALEKVNQISGNTYDWKEGFEEIHSHKGNDVGVIAQEIESILPQLVTNRDTGYKAVQYEKLIPLLIEAVKELSAKVDRLEQK